jgi:hypothetical protein
MSAPGNYKNKKEQTKATKVWNVDLLIYAHILSIKVQL